MAINLLKQNQEKLSNYGENAILIEEMGKVNDLMKDDLTEKVAELAQQSYEKKCLQSGVQGYF